MLKYKLLKEQMGNLCLKLFSEYKYETTKYVVTT